MSTNIKNKQSNVKEHALRINKATQQSKLLGTQQMKYFTGINLYDY